MTGKEYSAPSGTPTKRISATSFRRLSAPPVTGIRLKRQLGLLHGVAIISGLVIGGGIFISPKGVVQYAGSPGLSLVLWGVGGILSLLGALTYAEIGVVFPVAGEKYAYLEELYGQFMAYVYVWQYVFLTRPGANAIKAFLTAVNCFSVKASAFGQNILTTVSMTTLAIISISGAVWIYQGNTEFLKDPFAGSTTSISGVALATFSTIFTYYGWTALNFMIEELENPSRNLPLAIVISILLTTVLYAFVNLSYFAVIGVDGILTSEAVAMSVSFRSLRSMAWVVPILIAFTACGSFNAGIMCGSRLSLAGARQGHLPPVLRMINIKSLTPTTAIILQGLLAILFIWTIEVYTLINNLVFGMLLFDALVVIAYIRYRIINRQELQDRLFKLPIGVPVAYFVLVSLLVGVPLVTKPTESAIGVGLSIGLAASYYLVVIKWFKTTKRGIMHRKLDELNVVIQKILYCVPEGDSSGLESEER